MDAAVDVLVGQVLGWLGLSPSSHLKSILLKVLEETYPNWESIARKAMQQGSKSGLKLLEYEKEAIMEVLVENEGLAAVLAEFGSKTVGRVAAEIVAKQAAGSLSRMVLHSATKATVQQSAKVGAAAVAEKTLLATLGGSAVNPGAIGADFIQGILEYLGKPKLGKGIGMAGNIGANAVFGLVAGGPMGAAVGAMCGAGLWFVGEIAGRCIEDMVK